jgi:hypothetical protein
MLQSDGVNHARHGPQTPDGGACSGLAKVCWPPPLFSSTSVAVSDKHSIIHSVDLFLDWRRPGSPSLTDEYAAYVKVLTWFFDTPSPLSPFSIHRMALAGKALGNDVGTWFEPGSVALSIK